MSDTCTHLFSRGIIDDSKIAASLTDDSRGAIYDRNIFIIEATGLTP